MQTEIPSHEPDEVIAAPLPIRLVIGLLVLIMTAGLLYALVSFYPPVSGLRAILTNHMPESGVSHPVTAVLLNFRGYDTLLEMGVLLLALIGMWSLTPSVAESTSHLPGPVQDSLTRLLAPLIILMSGYLLWAGAHAPGGAFQAGALLTAAGILLLLSGWHLPDAMTQQLLRAILVAGMAVFIGVALTTLWTNSYLLAYPPHLASSLILLIETFATVSIGTTLAALFIGGRPKALENAT